MSMFSFLVLRCDLVIQVVPYRLTINHVSQTFPLYSGTVRNYTFILFSQLSKQGIAMS
jgi:hypothetical protein